MNLNAEITEHKQQIMRIRENPAELLPKVEERERQFKNSLSVRETEYRKLEEVHHKLEVQLSVATFETNRIRQETQIIIQQKTNQIGDMERELNRLARLKQQYDEALLKKD
jgi:hypothetical protein